MQRGHAFSAEARAAAREERLRQQAAGMPQTPPAHAYDQQPAWAQSPNSAPYPPPQQPQYNPPQPQYNPPPPQGQPQYATPPQPQYGAAPPQAQAQYAPPQAQAPPQASPARYNAGGNWQQQQQRRPPPQQQPAWGAQPPQQAQPAAAAAAAQAPPGGAGQLDGELVTQVLMEFCQTDYVRTVCQAVNAAPTDYGQIWGLFESVRLNDRRLVVQLKRSFEQKSETLLDKLSKHLRRRLPGQLERLEYKQGTMVRTIII